MASELCYANSYQSGKAPLPQQHAPMLKFPRFWERKLMHRFTHIMGLRLMNLRGFFSNLISLLPWRAWGGMSAPTATGGHGASEPLCTSETRSSPAASMHL